VPSAQPGARTELLGNGLESAVLALAEPESNASSRRVSRTTAGWGLPSMYSAISSGSIGLTLRR